MTSVLLCLEGGLDSDLCAKATGKAGASTGTSTPQIIFDSPGPMLPPSGSCSVFRTANDPEERLKARHELLASLPLPEGVPDEELKPLVLPGTMTIKEFILSASNVRPPFSRNVKTNLPRLAPVPQKQVRSYVTILPVGLTPTSQVVELPHPSRAHDCVVSRPRRTRLHANTDFQVRDEPTDCNRSQLERRGRHRISCGPNRMLLQQGRKVVLCWDVPSG